MPKGIVTNSRIIIARHGETEWNKADIIMGALDSPLTPKGIETASKIAGLLSNFNVDAVYSSHLSRALQSAKIYCQNLNQFIIVDPRLSELSCGEWETRPRNLYIFNNPSVRASWDFRPPGGESYRDGEARITPFFEELNKTAADREILLVTHASLNRVILHFLLNLDKETAMRIQTPHDAVCVVENGRGQFLHIDGRRELISAPV